ncbi:MAG: hypothetical protein H7Y18_03210 [Clostridiaceae bacterium]|nr:hypothetical protein [Clostridiaceae bacterium]
MVDLGVIHYAYLIIVFLIIAIICFKKDIVLPCIIGIAIIGYIYSGNMLKTLQIIFMAILVSGMQFIEIIIIIALVYAMSKALREVGVDEMMLRPISKLIKSKNMAFFILGFTMLIFSWFIWPSPAVVFVGAIMLPIAIKAGLPRIWAAVSMSIFGPGIALSSDYFIQAAPSITSKTAGINNSLNLIKASFPLWMAMSCTTVLIAFIIMKKDLRKGFKDNEKQYIEPVIIDKGIPKNGRVISIVVPIIFIADIIFIYIYKIKGTDASALIGGTAIMTMIISNIMIYGLKDALEKSSGLIRDGFMFSIKVFSPVIIIGAFFFLGSKETASSILGTETNGLLTEVGMYLAYRFPLSKVSVVLIHSLISGMLGVGGSGFSGLPLIGTLSQVFSSTLPIKKEGLAALGQIITIWVGGGTIVPWSVISVAAICEVEPLELVSKNIIPVLGGFLVMIITAIFIL